MQQLQAAVALHNQGELDQAEEIYRSLTSFDCTRLEALNRLGVLLRVQGLLQDGRECLRKSLEIDTGQALVWYCLGNSFLQTREYMEAASAYKSALEIGDAKICGLWNNLGKALEGCGDRDQAFKCYKNEILVCPTNYNASLTLANRFKERGQMEEAIACYRKAIELKPDFADAYLGLGIVLKEEGEVEEAIASCRKAIELKPDFADAYLNLGFALKEKGEAEAAADAFAEHYRLKPIAQSLSFASAAASQSLSASSEVAVPEGAKFIPLDLS